MLSSSYRVLYAARVLTHPGQSSAVHLIIVWLDKYISLPWIIPVLGLFISILTSLTLFFKLREKGTNLQQTAVAMDWEHMARTLGIGKYAGLDMTEALRLLATTLEDLRKEQQ